MPNKLSIDVDRDDFTGRLQVSINQRDENGHGHGHRLLGPKYLGASEQVATADLSRYDADSIRTYLDANFPAQTAFPVVTICGSMRFAERMLAVAAELTTAGRIVLMPHDASLTGIANKTALEHGRMLDDMHKAKIRMSGSIYVVNTGRYIGESTRSEIDYATALGLPIQYDEQD